MSQPKATFDQGITALSNFIKILDEVDKFMNANATNFLGLKSTFNQSNQFGDFQEFSSRQMELLQSGIAGRLTEDAVRANLEPFLRELVQSPQINKPDRGFVTNALEVLDYMENNSETFYRS